jgi:hypothetical protein
MRRITLTALLLFATGSLASADPLHDFFYYQSPQPPVAGSCPAIAASVGAANTWYGEFAGTRYDEFTERGVPFSARGCFDSEYACRAWQHTALTYIGQGRMVYTTCREGVRGD